jgi:hypothetical protein
MHLIRLHTFRNPLRKESGMNHRKCFYPAWLVALLICTPAMGQDYDDLGQDELPACMRAQHGFYLQAPGLGNKFQPSGLHFKDEGMERTVTISGIRFVKDEDLLRREALPGQPDRHKLILRNNRQAFWEVNNQEDRVSFVFQAPQNPGTVRVTLLGATRAVAWADGKLTVVRDFSTPTSLTSPAALQNGQDQQGLTLSWSVAGKNAKALIEQEERGLLLEIPYQGGQEIRLEVTSFAGDSLLALENVDNDFARAGGDGESTGFASVDAPETGSSERLTYIGPSAEEIVPAKTEDGWFNLFPAKKRLMAPLLADQRETTMRFGYMGDKEHETHFDVQFGGDLVLWWWRLPRQHELTLSVRGLASTRFMVDDNFPQLNTDYIGGLALGYRWDQNVFELLLYHESSHLGDETLDFGRRNRIDYAREAIRLLWSREILEDLRVYFGPTYNFGGADPKDIAGKWIVQGGAEYQFRLGQLPMYAAVDLQTKEENDWRVNTNAQLGLFLLEEEDESIIHRPRVFLEYFNGNSNMGQYYNEHEATWMLGFGFEL